MSVPRVTSIFLVAFATLSFLNFLLKYYTYFVLMVSSSRKTAHDVNNIAEETGEVPHPHELYVPLLTFIPTKSPVITRPWVLVTCSFIEENVVGFGLSFMTFFYLGKYIENLWGSKEFTKFLAVNIVLGNLTIYLIFSISSYFMDIQDIPHVVVTPMAVIMGLFVAIKQRIPNHYFLFFGGNIKLKVNYIPFLMLLVAFGLRMLWDDGQTSFNLALLGFTISWVYLRFFKTGNNERQSYLLPFALNRRRSGKARFKVKKQSSTQSSSSAASLHIENEEIRGDRSVQFEFQTFFPYPLSLLVKGVSAIVFKLSSRYNIVDRKSFIYEQDLEDDDLYAMEDTDSLQSRFFGLSPLNGVRDVTTFGNVGKKFEDMWHWMLGDKARTGDITDTMENRRRQALKQFE